MKRLLVALAATALLVGCGGGDDNDEGGTQASKGEPVEIEFWHGQVEGTATLLQEMIDDFNSTHPNVVVSKDAGGVNSDRMLQKVTAGLQADNYPDIAYIYGSDLANLALSDRRAEAVADALTNVFDVPPENLAPQGYGEQYLKVKTEGRERENRRVAIRRITPLVKPVASAQ